MHSVTIRLPAETSEAELLATVDRLNADPRSTASWSSCRCPSTSTASRCSTGSTRRKDVDGFHPVNVGKLVDRRPDRVPARHAVRGAADADPLRDRDQGRPCGDRGSLEHRGQADGQPADPAGARWRCHGDGVPFADPRSSRRVPGSADILVAAIGKAEFVTAEMVRPGAVVIDVGINRVDDASRPKGYRLVGDVAYGPVSRGSVRHHSGARRRRPYDDRHAAAEHAAGHAAGGSGLVSRYDSAVEPGIPSPQPTRSGPSPSSCFGQAA